RFETKVPLSESAHGTDVHDIRRVAVIEFHARIDPQLGVVSAIEDAELAGLRDLIREAYASRAQDAALLVQHHVGTECHGLVLLHFLLAKPRIVEPEVQIKILQVALAGLVADRTIEWMVSQQELQHRAPAILRLGVLGAYHHSFRHRCVAGDLKFGKLLHVYQADAAVARDRECWMIAVARNEDTQFLSRLDDRGSFGNADVKAIYAQLGHVAASRRPSLLPLRI